MEFIINTDLEKSLPAVIDFNFDELKTELAEGLTHYKALVVTADSIKAGKADRAKLNNLKSAVEDRRKEVKKRCLAPYEAFEAKCKELTGMIDEASSSIDAQVKAFEDAEKDEKRKALDSAYQEHIGDLGELLPLEKIFNTKWLNKTVMLAAAVAELRAVIDKVRNDIKIIRALRCECEDQMLTAYLTGLDMSAAMAEKSRYEARKEQLAKLAARTPSTIYTGPVRDELSPEDRQAIEEIAQRHRECNAAATEDESKDIEVIFYATTAAFRAEMKALTEKHDIKYGSVKR